MSAHTPGPWRISMSGYSVKSMCDDMPIVASNPRGLAMKERHAQAWLENARLISAAPDLLEAVRQLRDLAEREGWRHVAIYAADKAIAKAEGRSE